MRASLHTWLLGLVTLYAESFPDMWRFELVYQMLDQLWDHFQTEGLWLCVLNESSLTPEFAC